MVMLAALIVCPACGDDGDDKTSDDPGSNSTVFLQNVDYTLKVDSGGQLFSEEDVSKPLVMDVKGDGVSGSLTLKSVDGTFAGKLTVPVGVADTLTLTGTVSVPAAGGDADYQSIISLEDLMDKCGHLYTAKFNYKWDEPAALADSKAYFHFVMSPLQHWMMVNSSKVSINKDGEVWVAFDEKTAVVTNFYKLAYEKVEGGKVYDVDRSGFVDLGFQNVLWADKNVGAKSYEDVGGYYVWTDALDCVSLPLSLPEGGESGDFAKLCDLTEQEWGEYNDMTGYFYMRRGYSDRDKDPFIFLPAAGTMIGGLHTADNYGFYWSSKQYDRDNAYRLYFREGWTLPDGYCHKSNMGSMSVRAVWRGDAQEVDPNNHGEQKELQPFFPMGYPWEEVVAWYTSKDEDKKEEWALYLFADNTYAVTQYIMQKDDRVVHFAGGFSVVGVADESYDDFVIVASVRYRDVRIRFIDGECTFMGRMFSREDGKAPAATPCTIDNNSVPAVHLPSSYLLDNVVAWYRQNGPDYNDFMVLFLFNDNTYSVCTCQVKDGGQKGSEFVSGMFTLEDGSELDFENMTVNATAVGAGFSYPPQTVTFANGTCTMFTYTFELQDLALLWEILGFKSTAN